MMGVGAELLVEIQAATYSLSVYIVLHTKKFVCLLRWCYYYFIGVKQTESVKH